VVCIAQVARLTTSVKGAFVQCPACEQRTGYCENTDEEKREWAKLQGVITD